MIKYLYFIFHRYEETKTALVKGKIRRILYYHEIPFQCDNVKQNIRFALIINLYMNYNKEPFHL